MKTTSMSAEAFRAIRAKSGLSMRDFAEEVGIGLSSVVRYESGKAPIPKVVARSMLLLELMPPKKR